MIDLQPFCSTDETRYYLNKPWSRGEFAYATNGHILIRVPRRPDVPENDKSPDIAAVIAKNPSDGVDFVRVAFNLPPARTGQIECPSCDGRGVEHDCPECTCVCYQCKGEQLISEEDGSIAVDVNGGPFAIRYCRMLAALPDIEVPAAVSISEDHGFMWFRFTGGDGMLMGMRSPAQLTGCVKRIEL